MEFWRMFQTLYLINRSLRCEVEAKNGIYKLSVYNGNTKVIGVTGMSAYNVFSIAESQLTSKKEELK